MKNKDNKISHKRGNSLKNKVRGLVDIDSPDPLKPHPTGRENTERIALLHSNTQVLTEPVRLPGLPCRFNKAAAYCPQDDFCGPTIDSHRFDCNWLKLMCVCKSSEFTALALLRDVVCSCVSFHR